MKRFTVIIILFLASYAVGGIFPGDFNVDATPDPNGQIPSNSIIDIELMDEILWLGTGRGIGQYHINGQGWSTIQVGTGGVSALAVTDSIVWAATAYTETIDGDHFPAGGGVGYSRDEGETWEWMPQPVDPVDVVDYHPTTTNIQNVTYDVAMGD